MTLITVKVVEGLCDDAQKAELIERLTESVVEVEGENMRPVTWVVIEEVKSGDWGVAGHPMTTEAVYAVAAGAY